MQQQFYDRTIITQVENINFNRNIQIYFCRTSAFNASYNFNAMLHTKAITE